MMDGLASEHMDHMVHVSPLASPSIIDRTSYFGKKQVTNSELPDLWILAERLENVQHSKIGPLTLRECTGVSIGF